MPENILAENFWEKTIDDAIQKAKDEGGWMPEAKAKAIKGLMEIWRVEKAAKEQVQQEMDVETAEVDSQNTCMVGGFEVPSGN